MIVKCNATQAMDFLRDRQDINTGLESGCVNPLVCDIFKHDFFEHPKSAVNFIKKINTVNPVAILNNVYESTMIKSKIKIRTKYVPAGIKILYEDRDIIVIDKSSGLLTVKANYEAENTAHHLLTNYVRKGNPKARTELFVVHRLDRDTSGVLIFAKSLEIREKFARQWKTVEKKYIALVHGNLAEKSGIIESYLSDGEDYKVRSVKNPQDGHLAITKYRVIKDSKNYSLLEIYLLTGKKNQIRVHLSEKGHPVVGDMRYGKNIKGRLGLHAVSIKFKHPFNNEEMLFETKIPQYFLNYFSLTEKL